MTIEQYIKEECEEIRAEERAAGILQGKKEFLLSLLEDLGTISCELREKIQNETEVEKLDKWFKLAAKAESMEQFLKEM